MRSQLRLKSPIISTHIQRPLKELENSISRVKRRRQNVDGFSNEKRRRGSIIHPLKFAILFGSACGARSNPTLGQLSNKRQIKRLASLVMRGVKRQVKGLGPELFLKCFREKGNNAAKYRDDSVVHGSLDSATAETVLFARYQPSGPSLSCLRAARVGTSPRGKRATSPGRARPRWQCTTCSNLSTRRE